MDHPSRVEFEELHEYVRHEVGVYFAWLTFFLTIVLGAMAWALKASVNATGVIDSFPVVFIVLLGFFLIQIGLGIGGTVAVLEDIERAEQRSRELLKMIGAAFGDAAYIPQQPLPGAYARALKLAKWSLIANLFFWPVVGLFVLWAWYTCFPMGGLGSPTN